MGNPYTFPLNQGGGFLGGGSDDYSTYANFVPFTPFPVVGKHELDCFARAFSNDFDGSPVITQTVSAPYTGMILGPEALALADLGPELTCCEDLLSTSRVSTLLISPLQAQ